MTRDEQIVVMARGGVATRDIAAELGMSTRRVNQIRSDAGVGKPEGTPRVVNDQRVAELTRRGLSAREIAEILGCTERSVGRSRRRSGTIVYEPTGPMTEDEVRFVQGLIEDGCSYHDVARTVNRHWTTIAKRWPGRGWSKDQVAEYRTLARRLESL